MNTFWYVLLTGTLTGVFGYVFGINRGVVCTFRDMRMILNDYDKFNIEIDKKLKEKYEELAQKRDK